MNPDSAADSAAAKRRAIKLLAARDRTAHELHTRLSRDYEPSVVEEVLAYLEDRGYIDDGRFARNYGPAHAFAHGKPWPQSRAAAGRPLRDLEPCSTLPRKNWIYSGAFTAA